MNKFNNIKKKLLIYPHLGCVDIEIYNKQIKVLPAHMFCLELFVSFDTCLSYDLIFNKVKQNMSNYTDEYIKSIIDSLFDHILIKTKDDIRVKTNINNNINMIDIYYSINNVKQTIIKEMKEELCHNKNDIIMANINHFVKKFDKINIDVLYELVSNNINLFKMNKDIFSKAIDRMTINDYISLEDNNIRKIDWEQ